jgi:hypothetical protein
MSRGFGVGFGSRIRPVWLLDGKLPSDSVHGDPVIIRFEEMTIAVHRNGEGAVAGEGLHGLGRELGIDPA